MPTRKSEAVWKGSLKEGQGTMKFGSGAFEGSYSFASRFEEGRGTNPEELIAAAHAGCFSMALAGGLASAGYDPKQIHTTANVTIEKSGDGFTITKSDLLTEVEAPGIDEATLQQQAESAKRGCPVSKALAGVEITMRAKLLQPSNR